MNAFPWLDALVECELLRGFDAEFARSLARLASERDVRVVFAAAAASRALSDGHVCIPLGWLKSSWTEAVRACPAFAAVANAIAAEDSWVKELCTSALVGDGDAATPLVLRDDKLYLWRYWDHERAVARWLMEASEPVLALDADDDGDIERVFGNGDEQASQRKAASVALRRPLCIVTGGPGTGKTSTVVKILAVMVERARRGGQSLRVSLLAPTGKAAARLSEAVSRAKQALACDDEVKQAIEHKASTIHRALGSIAGSSTRFLRNAAHPLEADVVVLDEASMVDLALLRRLLDAVPLRSRVIMLGDPDQLASVEAGSIFGDICELVDDEEVMPGPSPRRRGAIVRLRHSFRFTHDSALGNLAQAIRSGDVDRTLALLEGASDDVSLRDAADDRQLERAVGTAAAASYAAALSNSSAVEQLEALGRVRVLCALRHGKRGVETINRVIEGALARTGSIVPGAEHYVGRLVMVTHNDAQTGLFNGDVGLEVASADGEQVKVAFAAAAGTVRILVPARLPAHETVFAMSVHKAQGSEFDEVILVLPHGPSPVVSRELLYTAVTRARHRVVIHAPRSVIADAVSRPVARASGLASQLDALEP